MRQQRSDRKSDPYREAARRLYQLPADSQNAISIGPHAALQHVEDGAFVEAWLWVPNAAVPEEATGGWSLGQLEPGA